MRQGKIRRFSPLITFSQHKRRGGCSPCNIFPFPCFSFLLFYYYVPICFFTFYLLFYCVYYIIYFLFSFSFSFFFYPYVYILVHHVYINYMPINFPFIFILVCVFLFIFMITYFSCIYIFFVSKTNLSWYKQICF